MTTLRCLLVGDGPSDRVLLHPLKWLLKRRLRSDFAPEWSFEFRSNPRNRRLAGKLEQALRNYPSDLVFVHRDAESQDAEMRLEEIQDALRGLQAPPSVPVVPVHMTEAWLLFDAQAIRSAVDNPNGKNALNLPPLNRLEARPDPKRTFFEAARAASGLPPRRWSEAQAREARYRVFDFVEDFSPLLALSAFAEVEDRLKQVLSAHGWAAEAVP